MRASMLMAALALTAFLMATGEPAQARAQPVRLVWSHGGGSFNDVGNRVWHEINAEGQHSFTFREIARNADYIELYDASRPCWVRLYADAMYLKGGDFPNYTRFYEGNWSE